MTHIFILIFYVYIMLVSATPDAQNIIYTLEGDVSCQLHE